MNAPSTLERPRIPRKRRTASKRRRRAPRGLQVFSFLRSAWNGMGRAVYRTTANRPVRRASQGLRVFSYLRSAWNAIRRRVSPLQLRCGSRRLRTLETLPLGNNRTVLLVRVDGQEFLLSSTEKTVSLLAELDKPPVKEKVAAIRPAPRIADLVANFNSSVQ